jgi:uncharacterized protein YebE (UPF0316 family)
MLSTVFSLTALYFFIISIVNVILSSMKSICTVRYGRGINVLANVISYSFYVIVVKQTADLPLEITVVSTAAANALGVWLSYVILDKLQKDRLWKIEVVVDKDYTEALHKELNDIPHNYIDIGPRTLFNFYCSTRKETSTVIKHCKKYNGKFFAVEDKFRGQI